MGASAIKLVQLMDVRVACLTSGKTGRCRRRRPKSQRRRNKRRQRWAVSEEEGPRSKDRKVLHVEAGVCCRL